MTTQEVTYIACPQCQHQYETPITSLIDVSQNPPLKIAFLRGQINSSQCPQCNLVSPLDIPIFYHDQTKELALIYAPGVGLAHSASQKIIGDLTNRVMNSLPPEERKAYLLTPQTFLTLDSLKKVVLEADGITEEVMQAQAAKIQLMQQMLRANDEASLKQIVSENDSELDRQFFEILSSMIFDAMSGGEQERAQGLLGFRQMIAEWSSQGTTLVAEIDQAAGFEPLTPASLLERLKSATNEEEFVELIARGRQLLDYTFFQNLTNQIDALATAGNSTEAEALKSLRSRILDTSAKIEEANRQAISQASKLLNDLISSPDPKSLIADKLPEFNEVFMALLASNIQQAQQQNQQAVVDKLTSLHNQIITAIQESIPPEFALLNELLQIPSPEMLKQKLMQHRTLITPEFFTLIERAKADFERENQSSMVTLLEQIKTEAETIKQGGIILTP